jgi:hypothetical protein
MPPRQHQAFVTTLSSSDPETRLKKHLPIWPFLDILGASEVLADGDAAHEELAGYVR